MITASHTEKAGEFELAGFLFRTMCWLTFRKQTIREGDPNSRTSNG